LAAGPGARQRPVCPVRSRRAASRRTASLTDFSVHRVDVTQAHLVDGPDDGTVPGKRSQGQHTLDFLADVVDTQLVRRNLDIVNTVPQAQSRLDIVAALLFH